MIQHNALINYDYSAPSNCNTAVGLPMLTVLTHSLVGVSGTVTLSPNLSDLAGNFQIKADTGGKPIEPIGDTTLPIRIFHGNAYV